jgi:hypothetical protein
MRSVLSGTEGTDFPWGVVNHDRVVDFWTHIDATSRVPFDSEGRLPNFLAIHLVRSGEEVTHRRTCIYDPDLYDPADRDLLDNPVWLRTRLAELQPDFPPLP